MVVQSGSRVTPDEREIPRYSPRNGYARDDAVDFEIKPHHYGVIVVC